MLPAIEHCDQWSSSSPRKKKYISAAKVGPRLDYLNPDCVTKVMQAHNKPISRRRSWACRFATCVSISGSLHVGEVFHLLKAAWDWRHSKLSYWLSGPRNKIPFIRWIGFTASAGRGWRHSLCWSRIGMPYNRCMSVFSSATGSYLRLLSNVLWYKI